MKQNCVDAFEAYDLPFECYFNACVDHEEIVHDELEFIWLLEGNITITCAGNVYRLEPDTVFIIYIDQKHSMKSDGYTLSASFRFKKAYLKALNLYFERLPFKNRVFSFDELAHKYPEVPLIMMQLIKLMQGGEDVVHTRYQLIGYYNMYVYDLYSVRLKEKYLDIKKKKYDAYLARFHKINTYIEANYSQKITLEELATLTEISTYRMSHFIKEILGISFQEYLTKVRLEKAIQMLKNTDTPINEVVKKCGFSDQKYLNAIMKSLFHVTAHGYRQIMKDDKPNKSDVINHLNMVMEFSKKLQTIDQIVRRAK